MSLSQIELQSVLRQAETRDAVAQLKIAKHYMIKDEFDQAIRWFKEAIKSTNEEIKAEAKILLAKVLSKQCFPSGQAHSSCYNREEKIRELLTVVEEFLNIKDLVLAKRLFSENLEIYKGLKKIAMQEDRSGYYYGSERPQIKAAKMLGQLNIEGKLIPQDFNEAVKYYNKAAENNAAILHWLGDVYYRGNKTIPKDMAKAAKYFERAVEEGRSREAKHHYDYATVYHRAQGVAKDTDKAIRAYKEALELNRDYTEAKYSLAQAFEEKFKEADKGAYSSSYRKDEYKRNVIRYYQEAAEKGHKDATNNLGLFFYNNKEFVEAFKWFKKAAELGLPAGKYKYAVLQDVTFAGVTKDKKSAIEWYKRAAADDYNSAQYTLGLKYENGEQEADIDKHPLQALDWYMQAAQGNLEEAKNKLASSGLFVELQKVLGSRIKNYLTLESSLRYTFNNPILLWQALNRNSWQTKKEATYKELELVGDGVLGLVVIQELTDRLPQATVGDKQGLKDILVSNTGPLLKIARDLSLDKMIMVSEDEKRHVVTDNMLADAMEAIIGAIFRDSGYERARKIVIDLWRPHIEQAFHERAAKSDVERHVKEEAPIMRVATAASSQSRVPALNIAAIPIVPALSTGCVKEAFTPRSNEILQKFGHPGTSPSEFKELVTKCKRNYPGVLTTLYGKKRETILHRVLEGRTIESNPHAASKLEALTCDEAAMQIKNKQGKTPGEILATLRLK